MQSTASRSRALRPRATADTPIVPATVTDLTAPTVLGLEPRQFRELVAREAIAHARVGHRMIVRLDVFLEALDRMAERSRTEPAPVEGGEGGAQPSGVERVLQLVGRTRVNR